MKYKIFRYRNKYVIANNDGDWLGDPEKNKYSDEIQWWSSTSTRARYAQLFDTIEEAKDKVYSLMPVEVLEIRSKNWWEFWK